MNTCILYFFVLLMRVLTTLTILVDQRHIKFIVIIKHNKNSFAHPFNTIY